MQPLQLAGKGPHQESKMSIKVLFGFLLREYSKKQRPIPVKPIWLWVNTSFLPLCTVCIKTVHTLATRLFDFLKGNFGDYLLCCFGPLFFSPHLFSMPTYMYILVETQRNIAALLSLLKIKSVCLSYLFEEIYINIVKTLGEIRNYYDLICSPDSNSDT